MITIRDKKMQSIVNKNKGFTLTEMVIVIAVIAILAAVLIPTFIGIANKAKLSADVQTAKNASTLATGENDIQDIYNAVANNNEETKSINIFDTQYAKRMAYEANSKQFVLLNDKYEIIENDAVKNQPEINLWFFARNNDDIVNAEKLSSYKVSYYMVNDYSGNFSFNSLVGFNTGSNTLNGNVYYGENSAITASDTITISGNINGKLYVNAPNAEVEQNGYIKEADIKAVKGSSFVVNGSVDTVKIAKGRLAVAQGAYVQTVNVHAEANPNTVKVDVKGFVNKVTGNMDAVSEIKLDGGVIPADGLPTDISESKIVGEASSEIKVNDVTDLINFRNQVNNGTSFAGLTVKLMSDVRLPDGWTPIGAFSRNDGIHTLLVKDQNKQLVENTNFKNSFAGIFDGGNHIISNLNNNGFDVYKTQALGSNDTTYKNRQEYAYGLFGVITSNDVDNPVVIKNLTISTPNINIPGDANSLAFGDSVAPVVGFVSGNVVIENVDVLGGSVSAHDAVGGLVGRIYDASSIIIRDCNSTANVSANCKAGGIVGFISFTAACNVDISTCAFNGNVAVKPLFNPNHSVAFAAGIVGGVQGNKTSSINIEGCEVSGTFEAVSTYTYTKNGKTANTTAAANPYVNFSSKTNVSYDESAVEAKNNAEDAIAKVNGEVVYPVA